MANKSRPAGQPTAYPNDPIPHSEVPEIESMLQRLAVNEDMRGKIQSALAERIGTICRQAEPEDSAKTTAAERVCKSALGTRLQTIAEAQEQLNDQLSYLISRIVL